MERISLKAIATTYHEEVKKQAREAAEKYVAEIAVPALTGEAKIGRYSLPISVPKSLQCSDVKEALLAKVECEAIIDGRTIYCRW